MTKIFSNASVSENVQIGEFSIIGIRRRPSLDVKNNKVLTEKQVHAAATIIESGCYIGSHVIIEEGVSIGANCIIEANTLIEKGTILGSNSIVVHGARILQHAKIGSDCVIGGFIADRSIIGDGCRVLGELLHKQDKPHLPWDENIEDSPVLSNCVFVGRGAKLIGNITICAHVYICAGSILTKDVASLCIVRGVNEIIPVSEWTGNLSNSLFWKMNK